MSLKKAALVLHEAATSFNTTYTSEIARLKELQQDLKASLNSTAKIQILGNTSVRCLAALPGFQEPVRCACVGSSLISNYSDPCTPEAGGRQSQNEALRLGTPAKVSPAEVSCRDIQPNGNSIPGSNNGSVQGNVQCCENICSAGGEDSAPLLFGSLGYYVSKDVVDSVINQLFPKNADITPPFVSIKSNLTALRYKLLGVEGRTQPLTKVFEDVTQALIEQVSSESTPH